MSPRIPARSKIWLIVTGFAALTGSACEDDREGNWYWPPNYEATSASRSGQAGSVATSGGTSAGGTTGEAGSANDAGSPAAAGAAGNESGGAGGSEDE